MIDEKKWGRQVRFTDSEWEEIGNIAGKGKISEFIRGATLYAVAVARTELEKKS